MKRSSDTTLTRATVIHGFVRFADGTITALNAPGAGTTGATGTYPAIINDNGVIAGYYSDPRSRLSRISADTVIEPRPIAPTTSLRGVVFKPGWVDEPIPKLNHKSETVRIRLRGLSAFTRWVAGTSLGSVKAASSRIGDFWQPSLPYTPKRYVKASHLATAEDGEEQPANREQLHSVRFNLSA